LGLCTHLKIDYFRKDNSPEVFLILSDKWTVHKSTKDNGPGMSINYVPCDPPEEHRKRNKSLRSLLKKKKGK